MATKREVSRKVSKREYNQWVKWLRTQGYSGPFAGLTTKHESVKLLAKELKREPPTILETCPRDPRTIASNLTRYGRGKGRRGGVDESEEGPKGTNLVSQKRLDAHYQRLCKLLQEFSNRVRIPELPRLHLLTLESDTPIPHSLSDMFGPVIMMYDDKKAVRLDVEGEFLWSYLKEHLIAEFPEFSENLGDWKKGIATIAKRCHDITKTIADQLAEKRWDAAEFGLSQDSKDYGPGVYYNSLTVSIYQCVVDNYLPQFRRICDSRGLLLLDMEGPWGHRPVARGGSLLLDQVEQFCHDTAGDEAIKKKVRQTLSLVKKNLEPLQESIKRKLQLVLERGTFKGSCQICSDLAS